MSAILPYVQNQFISHSTHTNLEMKPTDSDEPKIYIDDQIGLKYCFVWPCHTKNGEKMPQKGFSCPVVQSPLFWDRNELHLPWS